VPGRVLVQALQDLIDTEPTRGISSGLQVQTERSQNARLTPHIRSVLSYVVAMSNKLPWSVRVDRRLAQGIRDIGAILPIAFGQTPRRDLADVEEPVPPLRDRRRRRPRDVPAPRSCPPHAAPQSRSGPSPPQTSSVVSPWFFFRSNPGFDLWRES